MKLTKSYVQCTHCNGKTKESELQITVNYDPSEKVVDEIISVTVVKHPEMVFTDITSIMFEQFMNQLDEMIDKITWPEEYASSIEGYDFGDTDVFKRLSYAAYSPYVPKEELDKVIYGINPNKAS